MDCVRKINFDVGECRLPCEGIYADIKKSKVEILDETEFQLLIDSYETWFLEGRDNSPFIPEGWQRHPYIKFKLKILYIFS